MSTASVPARPTYRVRALSVEACNCALGCNCYFGGTPNEGICEFIIGYHVQEGRLGDVDLRGVRAVVAAKYPNAIHEGHGHVVLFVDQGASPDQVNALVTILSGQAGGMPWEAIAGTIETFEGPILRPIEIETNGQRGRVRIPGTVELETKPIRNPLAGDQEIEVHMVYPKGGILWNDGNIVTTSTMRVSHDSLRLEWPGKFAVIAEVTWTNTA
ncbi:MAG TPA: DUF1326 domain-containing protein [Gemmatimonadales bacterium]|nr:DUF1326 domain-containing protein [Gemmatimonadales bacterium]